MNFEQKLVMNFNFTKSSSVYETFSPIYKVLKLLGMIPFEMNLQNGKISVEYLDWLWILVSWMFWTCLITWNIHLGAHEPFEESQIILTGWHWLLIFELGASFFIQTVNFIRRESIGELFEILHEVDQMVKLFFFNQFLNELLSCCNL